MIARQLDTPGQQTRGQEEFPLNDDHEELQANKGMKDKSQARKKPIMPELVVVSIV